MYKSAASGSLYKDSDMLSWH